MVMCFVPDCKHYNQRDHCHFFKFPRDEEIKEMWIRSIRRGDRLPNKYSTVCSCHFINALKDNGPSIFPGRSKQKMFDSLDARHNVPKDNMKGPLKFVRHIPGREPRGQAPTPTFKDFIMSKEISKVQSKLTETCNKLAVLHKRRLSLRTNASSKLSTLSDSSTASLYPPYETHFNKPLTSLSVQPFLKGNVSSDKPLAGSSVDPTVEENLSSDNDSPSGSSFNSDSSYEEHLSSGESPNSSPLNSNESSQNSWHALDEENLSSDESLANSPSFEEKELRTPLYKSTDETSTNLQTSISSHEKTQTLTSSANFQKLLTPLDEKSTDKKCHKLRRSKIYEEPSSDKTLFKFKHRIPPSIVKKEDSSIAKHIKGNDAVHKYYLEQLASDKNVEDSLFSSSFRWEIANYKSKLSVRLARAQREKRSLRRQIRLLRNKTLYWKKKNADLKSLLDKQDIEQDAY